MTSDDRLVIVERSEIRAFRMANFRAIQKYRQEDKPTVYVGDLLAQFPQYPKSQKWTDGSARGVKAPSNKGQRLIIIHVGEIKCKCSTQCGT
jgi:hypothetical protein